MPATTNTRDEHLTSVGFEPMIPACEQSQPVPKTTWPLGFGMKKFYDGLLWYCCTGWFYYRFIMDRINLFTFFWGGGINHKNAVICNVILCNLVDRYNVWKNLLPPSSGWETFLF